MGKYENVETEEEIAMIVHKKTKFDTIIACLAKTIIAVFIIAGVVFLVVTVSTDWTVNMVGGNQGRVIGWKGRHSGECEEWWMRGLMVEFTSMRNLEILERMFGRWLAKKTNLDFKMLCKYRGAKWNCN